MSTRSWHVEDAEPTQTPPGVMPSSFVSLHYLRTALRRLWRLVAATTLLGALLASLVLAFAPAKSTASSTVLLAHDPGIDPNTAMSTDVALLETRTVAKLVIAQLHLAVTPDDLLKSMTTTQPTSQILQLSLTAPTEAEAVRRLSTLCSEFLQFRNAQLQVQAQSVVVADNARIGILRDQVDALNGQYDTATAAGLGQQATLLLSRRSQAQSEIDSLQSTVQDTALQADSLAAASHVVDTAAAAPPHKARKTILGVMSGLIGGSALGIGLVFLVALVSNRLRRRGEVAMALARPVEISSGWVRSPLPWGRKHRRLNLERLAVGLEAAIPAEEANTRLALVSAGDTRTAALVLQRTARSLLERGRHVVLVDLSAAGSLASTPAHDALQVYRPEGTAELANSPLTLVSSGSSRLADRDPRREQLAKADVVLVLWDVDLGAGTGHLSTWAERAVLLVAAGRVTAEYLRSTSRMFSASGPDLRFAMLVGADGSDESVGLPPEEALEEKPDRKAR